MAQLVDLIPGEQEDVWGQIVEDNIKVVNEEVESCLHREGGLAEDVSGVKTFIDKPKVPQSTWPVDSLAATNLDLANVGTKYLRDDGTWAVPPGSGGGGSANQLGTMNNPVTDINAARPTGLTRVVWLVAGVPVNWADGDFNLVAGA